MRDITEVLCEKEAQLERLGKELKVLRSAAKLLSEETGGASAYFDFNIDEPAEAVVALDKDEKDLWS